VADTAERILVLLVIVAVLVDLVVVLAISDQQADLQHPDKVIPEQLDQQVLIEALVEVELVALDLHLEFSKQQHQAT
jgi:hypothetical protein